MTADPLAHRVHNEFSNRHPWWIAKEQPGLQACALQSPQLLKGKTRMQVQVNSNHTMHTGESFERWARSELHESLSRFKGDITRIEVHMSDENSDKAGPDQKRCVMEARLARHDPLAVNHNAPNQDLAFRGASEKLKRVLDHTLGKLRDHHRDRETIRHDAAPDAGTL